MSSIALNLLWLAPVGAFLWSGRRFPRRRWLATGALLGLVVESASLGLYALAMSWPLTFPLVVLGLPLALLHVAPGYELAVAIGFVPAGVEVEPPSSVTLLNALFWSASYAALGAWIDRRRAMQERTA